MDEVIITTGLITFGVMLGMIATAWAGRFQRPRRGRPAVPRLAAVEERLARLEDSVNTVALEMERIAEAHRFTARVLSDRLDALPPRNSIERVVTPH